MYIYIYTYRERERVCVRQKSPYYSILLGTNKPNAYSSPSAARTTLRSFTSSE